jgi:DnaJ-class molecular chaperone
MSSYIDKLKQALEEAKNPMITCCKCHGKGSYLVPSYEAFDINKDEWERRECELCHGTGKITLEFYESLQRGCRR